MHIRGNITLCHIKIVLIFSNIATKYPFLFLWRSCLGHHICLLKFTESWSPTQINGIHYHWSPHFLKGYMRGGIVLALVVAKPGSLYYTVNGIIPPDISYLTLYQKAGIQFPEVSFHRIWRGPSASVLLPAFSSFLLILLFWILCKPYCYSIFFSGTAFVRLPEQRWKSYEWQ